MSDGILIRAEEQKDWAAVHRVNTSAFGSTAEAALVDALREQASPVVSFVAEEADTIIGHIIFSLVLLADCPGLEIMGLAPMAVAPRHQRRGTGSALVRAGLSRCRQLGFGAVVVLGHPHYYPRFGFSRAISYGISCEYETSEEAFMIAELQSGFLDSVSGKIQYHPAFREL